MGIKWKEDYSAKTQRSWGVAFGLAAGLAFGVPIGWGAASFPTDTSFVLALLTALGTVGAAVGAVWVASRAEKRAEQERIRRGQSLKWFLAIKLGNIQSAAVTAASELERIAGLGRAVPSSVPMSYALWQAMNWLDPTDLSIHMDSLYVLGDDAHRYAEIFALAKARYQDLLSLSKAPITIANTNSYLDRLRSDFVGLNERVVKVVGLLNNPT